MLAEDVIKAGGIVYGAMFDADWNVVHGRIDTPEGLTKLRGSKYVYSRIGTSIRDAAADVAAGRRVLFSGTPCQAAAMRKIADDTSNLLIVEVVCHGAPEEKYWTAYLDAICKKLKRPKSSITSINFRDKRTGWKNYSFTITFADGFKFTQLHDDNLYMRAFLADFTLREACFRCPFKYPDGTKADITLGDFWGITQLAPEIDNNLGTTIVIPRTEKGNQAIGALTPQAELPLKDAAIYNPAIIKPASKPSKFENFRFYGTTNILPLFRKYAGIGLVIRLKRMIRKIILR